VNLAWAAALVAVGCSKPASKAEYDQIKRGMHRPEVDAVMEKVGSAAKSTVADAFPSAEDPKAAPPQQILEGLEMVRFGNDDSAVFVGYDAQNVAQVKVLRTAASQSYEAFALQRPVGAPHGMPKLLNLPPPKAEGERTHKLPASASVSELIKSLDDAKEILSGIKEESDVASAQKRAAEASKRLKDASTAANLDGQHHNGKPDGLTPDDEKELRLAFQELKAEIARVSAINGARGLATGIGFGLMPTPGPKVSGESLLYAPGADAGAPPQ
jgi:hypothetical protein